LSCLVRGAAVWALSRLGDAAIIRDKFERAYPIEADGSVRAEWLEAVRPVGEAAKGDVA
jgi:epoxyqueuosine reductase